MQNLLRFIMPVRKSLPTVDLDSVNDDTTKLRRAIESKEIYELDFGSIFSWRSFLELKAIFESYHQKYGNPISEVLCLNLLTTILLNFLTS